MVTEGVWNVRRKRDTEEVGVIKSDKEQEGKVLVSRAKEKRSVQRRPKPSHNTKALHEATDSWASLLTR